MYAGKGARHISAISFYKANIASFPDLPGGRPGKTHHVSDVMNASQQKYCLCTASWHALIHNCVMQSHFLNVQYTIIYNFSYVH